MERPSLSITEIEIRRRRRSLFLKCLISLMVLVLIGMGALLVYRVWFWRYDNPWIANNENSVFAQKTRTYESEDKEKNVLDETSDISQDSDANAVNGGEEGESSLQAQANILASQYDYDGAIALLKSQDGYDRNSIYKNLVSSYQTEKEGCTSYTIDQITHIFFHSLIYDDAKAFDGDEDSDGYNKSMATVTEFLSIISQMYNRGYVMVSLHDMIEVEADGTVREKEILLPYGKTPFVLSQDDCSYYHYMDGDGFAQKLIVTDDGSVKNTYVEDDGTIITGDFDVVPIIDSFVEQHPDFSYHGHKGILALTGYEGVLGYRTDEVYKTRQEDRLTQFQIDFLASNPDFDFDSEVTEATAVANAMKDEGWEFASHTWGHINPLDYTLEEVEIDNERWMEWVSPIVGDTDVLIFAFGADIADWEPYTQDNEYYSFYKSEGFDIYCNVDASVKAWVQINSDNLRQGRRNIDGYRMYYTPDLISDLFDVETAWDSNRPVPVPEM